MKYRRRSCIGLPPAFNEKQRQDFGLENVAINFCTLHYFRTSQPVKTNNSLMFIVGNQYTRDEIHATLGGSKVSCLPTQGGKIVAACLSQKFSPAAPHVVLCGQGERTGAVSKLLTIQSGKLPVFIKQAANRWEFHGNFRVDKSFNSGARFESFISGSGRSIVSVSYVVLLELD